MKLVGQAIFCTFPLVRHIDDLERDLWTWNKCLFFVGGVEPYKKYSSLRPPPKCRATKHVHVYFHSKEEDQWWDTDEIDSLFGIHGHYQTVVSTPLIPIWYSCKNHDMPIGDLRYMKRAHKHYCTKLLCPWPVVDVTEGGERARIYKQDAIGRRLKRARKARGSLVKADQL